MPASPFAAALFDLDGVLVDSERLANEVWVALLAETGLRLPLPDFMARAVGRTHRDLLEWLARDHGWTLPDGFLAELDTRLLAAFAATPAIEGAAETLQALRAAGVPYAVASNSERGRLRRKVEAAGLAGLIGAHAYDPAHVGGHGKPAPDLYLHAARQLGVDIRRCVVVEDSATGVRAGVAAGARVWGLLAGGHAHPDDAEKLRQAGAERLLASHAELLQALGLAAAPGVVAAR